MDSYGVPEIELRYPNIARVESSDKSNSIHSLLVLEDPILIDLSMTALLDDQPSSYYS